jgi:hypothetical protein
MCVKEHFYPPFLKKKKKKTQQPPFSLFLVFVVSLNIEAQPTDSIVVYQGLKKV